MQQINLTINLVFPYDANIKSNHYHVACPDMCNLGETFFLSEFDDFDGIEDAEDYINSNFEHAVNC